MNGDTVRHSGDLGGLLVPGMPATVTVRLPERLTVADTHATWMLVNLLLRLKGVVDLVILDATDAIIDARVSPHVSRGTLFSSAIAALASNLSAVPLEVRRGARSRGINLHIGPGPAVTDGWRVVGRDWQATVSTAAIGATSDGGTLPFGPYAAACLAAGEIFRAVRLPPDRYTPISTVSVDTWDYGLAVEHQRPQSFDGVELCLGLAGVGAVGVAALQTLWACDGLTGSAVIADNDMEGIEKTNLNRYVLFDERHIGLSKATTASTLYGAGQVVVEPIDGPYDLAHLAGRCPAVLLSAVDTNEARHDLQRGIVPGVAFGASTEGLRAELVVTGPPDDGPCLACHNKLLLGIPDEVSRATVRSMSASELNKLTASSGISAQGLKLWAQTGRCGTVNPEMIGHVLRENEAEPAWSVGFVSVYAGVMLAAQAIRHGLDDEFALESTSTQFQFRFPQAEGNGIPQIYRRDAECGVCSNEMHRMVWAKHRSDARAQ
jgi:molybdopterin/thiamine biosynthesis adenylyltransferase